MDKEKDILCIIPSGKPKIWDKYPDIGAVKVEEAYTGIFHKLCQQYAKLHYMNWMILSPKYGFLKPNDQIEHTYDLSFSNIKKDPRVMQLPQLKEQLKRKNVFAFNEVVMLGGKKFKPIMEQLFEETVNISYPLHGMKGIGYMQQRLKEAIRNGEYL